MEDVAREAGVSRALVSIAYRGVAGVSDQSREHILSVGARLGYVPNRIAAQLASKGGDALGLFLQDLHNDVFADIHDGVREVASAASVDLVISVGTIDGHDDQRSLDTLLGHRVDVVIAAGLLMPDADLLQFAQRVPTVSVARSVPGIDSVYSDNFTGASLATQHLLNLGHTRIAFLSNPQTDGYLDRERGYRDTMAQANLAATVMPTTYSRAQAALDAGRLLDTAAHPTAIFAHNDLTALGVLDALALRHLAPGRDVSVVGYDNTSASQAPGSALTTVDIHSVELGREAARLAMHRVEHPDAPAQSVLLEPTLVVRGTTGPLA